MKQASESGWYEVRNVEEIPSPALLVYHDRMVENIRRMLAIAGAPGRLRPHVKTHKTGEIVRLQVEHGIRKCKCATIAEAEMAARNGATDILMAMQPVGPAVDRLLELKRQFSDAVFSTIVDAPEIVRRLGFASAASGFRTAVYVDINCGMNRTGIAPGEEAFQLYLEILRNPALEAAGLHVYDGHLREKDPARRRDLCDAAFAPVTALAERLRCAGLPVPAIVAGGTPSFPIHARRDDVELSPGTTVLWDETYRLGCPDLDFLLAALVLTRVVSKPAANLLCLDLGHKAIASEMPHPRVRLLGLEDAGFLMHSEEHLVVESPGAAHRKVGDHLYGVPTHVCPTVARFDRAYVVRDGQVVGEWNIEARDRMLSV